MLRPYEVEHPEQLAEAARREYDEWMADLAKEEAIYAEIGEAVTAQNQAFSLLWPKHCKACGGWGQLSWTENQSPLGSGECWSMSMSEPCSSCLEAGVCGRCGTKLVLTAETPEDEPVPTLPCPGCGWNCDSGLERA